MHGILVGCYTLFVEQIVGDGDLGFVISLPLSFAGVNGSQFTSSAMSSMAGGKSTMLQYIIGTIAAAVVLVAGLTLGLVWFWKKARESKKLKLLSSDTSSPEKCALSTLSVQSVPSWKFDPSPSSAYGPQPWSEALAPFLDHHWYIPPEAFSNVIPLSGGEFGEVLKGLLSAGHGASSSGPVALKKAKGEDVTKEL